MYLIFEISPELNQETRTACPENWDTVDNMNMTDQIETQTSLGVQAETLWFSRYKLITA